MPQTRQADYVASAAAGAIPPQEVTITNITITLANGRTVPFTVSDDGNGPPGFLLSVRKCGSTITNNICTALALANARCFVNVGGTFFNKNLTYKDWRIDPALRQILRPGAIYGGFRDMPVALLDDPHFVVGPKLIMIRDPRDALVSEYFSNAYSHSLPATHDQSDGMTKLIMAERTRALAVDIQTYVLRGVTAMARSMTDYAPVLSLPNTLVLKYEDMILRKELLIGHLARHFGMRASPQDISDILGWADKIPAAEDPRAFVREVLPGDHRKKLDDATIGRLNEHLSAAMHLFGYAA